VLLGEIVRAADSHPANPHPAGEGLRWKARQDMAKLKAMLERLIDGEPLPPDCRDHPLRPANRGDTARIAA